MGEVRQEPSYLAIQYLHDTEQYPVSKLCAALHIPRCSYYKWRKREKNKNKSNHGSGVKKNGKNKKETRV